MKKNVNILLGLFVLLTAGCVTTPPPQPKHVDIEPILVGKSVAQKVSESNKAISDQVVLLNKVQNKQPVGTYKVVKHNNDLDARVGSSKTIPQSYANKDKVTPEKQADLKNEIMKVQKSQVSTPKSAYDVKVSSIKWNNDSLNRLAENFSNSLGYQLVIKENTYKDKNINFTTGNIKLREAINKFKYEVKDIADVIIIDQNKTFNIIYK